MPGQANTSEQDMKKRVRNNRIASKYVAIKSREKFRVLQNSRMAI